MFLTSLIFGFITAGQLQTATMQQEIDGIVKWLPADTETLVIVKPEAFGSKIKKRDQGGPPTQWMCAPVADRKTKDEVIPRFVVHGARNFKEPNGLGLGYFECLEVDSYKPDDIKRVKDYFIKKVKKTAKINGQLAYVKTDGLKNNEISTYYIFSGNNLICTTSKAFLAEYQNQSDSKRKRFLVEPSLTWSTLNKDAPFTAFRRVSDRGRVRGYGMNFDDPQWREFAVNIYGNLAVKAYHVSDNKNARVAIEKIWTSPGLNGSVLQVSPQMIEIRIPPSGWEESMPIFFITIALGYAVFV